MEINLDAQRLDIPCPSCSHKISETVGRLKTSPKLTCRACGTAFNVEASKLKAGLDEADRAIADFKRSLGRFGK